MAKEKVRVRIRARQMVKYDQIRIISREDWDELKEMPPEEMAQTLSDIIDPNEIIDAYEIEDDSEIFVCDEKGKATSPRDEYTWEPE